MAEGLRRSVRAPQLLPRLLAFKIDGTGTASITQGATDATLTDNGTGDYTLTFTEPFQRAPVVVATPVTDVITVRLKSEPTATAVTFECVGADQTTPGDADFHVIVLGYDSPLEL